ncbi:GHKL domain-containing protein [Alginatibacterium sediminis]|uniref:histidine kinase n=1 Tax=Alginatibacterium sediminis TaxID=2164068 RepID=A0A420EG61_9ALTE|nr:ATP-binding protein [Alginatibacterium sediminis]RKF19653.1 GHKL domain-containing protein [Alginatibacterium sediminis]
MNLPADIACSKSANIPNHDLTQVFEVMPSALIILDAKGFIARINSAACVLLGKDLVGKRWLDVVPQIFAPRADDGHELSLKDGQRVQLNISPLSAPLGQLLVFTDLTQTRALQTRVARMQRLSSLGKMVASLAHQIRTPLSAAMLYAANLGNPNLGHDSQLNFQSKLVNRLNELEGQVSDMLLFAKGGDTSTATIENGNQLLEQLSISCETILAKKTQSLTLRYSDTALQIICNQSTLLSALSNLVENACHASEEHQQLVLSLEQEGHFASFSVEDFAGGISEIEKVRRCEPFYTTKANGTGLGLAVVNAVSKAHNGKLEFINTDRGCLAKVSIPLHDVQSHAKAVGE